MDRESQKDAVEAMTEWSRWLLGIDFLAATGCVIILQGGVSGLSRPFLILAICAFALSVLCAMLLGRLLVSVVERLPLLDTNGTARSIHDEPVLGRLSVGHLAHCQMLLLALGGVFFVAWIVL